MVSVVTEAASLKTNNEGADMWLIECIRHAELIVAPKFREGE